MQTAIIRTVAGSFSVLFVAYTAAFAGLLIANPVLVAVSKFMFGLN